MLKTRIATAAILVAGFLLAIYGLPQQGWVVFCAGILAVAAWEWAALAAFSAVKRMVFSVAMLVCGIAIAWRLSLVPWPGAVAGCYLIALAFWLLAMPIWLANGLRNTGNKSVALAGWVVLLPCFLAMVHLQAISPGTLLRYMAVVWIADSAAYFTGRRFGRNKLAPTISPGKTWEGVAGAMLGVTAYGILWTFYFDWDTPPMIKASFLGPVGMLLVLWFLATFSVCGDLLESALKRRAGVKDSGAIFPGHGGMLDRIDALLPVLPMAALLSIL